MKKKQPPAQYAPRPTPAAEPNGELTQAEVAAMREALQRVRLHERVVLEFVSRFARAIAHACDREALTAALARLDVDAAAELGAPWARQTRELLEAAFEGADNRLPL